MVQLYVRDSLVVTSVSLIALQRRFPVAAFRTVVTFHVRELRTDSTRNVE